MEGKGVGGRRKTNTMLVLFWKKKNERITLLVLRTVTWRLKCVLLPRARATYLQMEKSAALVVRAGNV